MGGENSPNKTIEGVSIFCKENSNKTDFLIVLYGDEKKINQELKNFKIPNHFIKIIHTENIVSDEETPLTAVKTPKIQVCGIVSNHKLMEKLT